MQETNGINAGFMGSFKVGDNINYNLKILKTLYDHNTGLIENKGLLNKPIIIIIVSIIEALLRDFIFKANEYTSEGIPNIKKEIIVKIRRKKYKNLDAYIAAARKHNIFNIGKEDTLYNDLDTLKNLRNRIHIHNEKNHFERDEEHAFSTVRKILAEKVLEKILRLMSRDHNRGFHSVEDFILVWRPHYPDID